MPRRPGPLGGFSISRCPDLGGRCIPRSPGPLARLSIPTCPDLQGWCIPRFPVTRIAASFPSTAGFPLFTPVRTSAVFHIHTERKPYRRIRSTAERYTEIARPFSGKSEEQLTSTDCWPTVGRQTANCWPTVGRQLADSWPTVGRQTANCRPSVGRQVFPQW